MMRASSLAALIVGIGLTSCATEAVVSPSALPSRPGTATAPQSEAASGQASPSPDTAAPPELAGRWRRSVRGEWITLTIGGTGYRLQVGPEMGSGSIAVDGDRIEFFDSNRCHEGIGVYTWTIENGRLRLTEIGDDPCGRQDFLRLGTWRRVDS